MPTPPGQSSSQPLPTKELGYFKKIVKSYEQKQYKTGLKFAKQILSTPGFTEHGETLAMKGLILNCMGKCQEAQECVKKGLKSDLRSYVCWHVYGLIQKTEKKYDEAIKAYKRALMIEKDNTQILRDLSLLQIQTRDFDGYLSSKYELLRLKQNQRVSWLGYIVAHHLLKEYTLALGILAEYIKNNTPPGYDFEFSELILYQNLVMREAGQPDVALQKLEENSTHIVDKVAYMETRANLLMDLEQPKQAEHVWRSLLDRNPECLEYYDMLQTCMGIKGSESAKAQLAMLDALAEKYQKAAAPRRLALYLVEGDELRRRLHEWMVPMLRKGAPSLFASLVPLYKYPKKVEVIESLINTYVNRMVNEGYDKVCLDDQSNNACEPPTTALWLYVLAAHHYDRRQNTTLALEYIERAIQHSPTVVENHMLKARIYKHAGDYNEAVRWMDEAQGLDTADRYINGKCGKYLLRAKQPENANKMLAKFTREGENAASHLTDMQCMWYELESGRAFRAMNKYGEALRKAHHIEFHFNTWIEDQYDFHTYCLRKMTICSYIRLLRMEDRLRNADYYYQGAKLAIKIYLRMVDRPDDMNENAELIKDGMTDQEIKKMKKKLKKQKEQQEEEDKKKKRRKGPQINAEELLKTEDPLGEAAKFCHNIHTFGTPKVTGYALCAEVYQRKGKVLLALKCLNEGVKKDPTHPLLHVQKVKFLKQWPTFELTGLVKDTADELVTQVYGNERDASALNEKFKVDHQHEFSHRLAYAEAENHINSGASLTSWLLKSAEDSTVNGRTLKMMIKLKDGIAYGKYGKWSKDENEKLRKLVHGLFPLSLDFGGGVVHKPAPAAEATVESK
uniref:TPR_REGION domain-containing protein n=1 Tax=Caenorhabditis tropicalis TaxID=1561998 RepID=A0A1I7UK25_9PELO